MSEVTKKKWRLTDLDLDFISLVFAGDDPSAQVVIAKAAHCTCENYTGSERNEADERVCEKCGLPVSKAAPEGMDLGVDQPLGDRKRKRPRPRKRVYKANRDGDGDGLIDDGTPKERPAPKKVIEPRPGSVERGLAMLPPRLQAHNSQNAKEAIHNLRSQAGKAMQNGQIKRSWKRKAKDIVAAITFLKDTYGIEKRADDHSSRIHPGLDRSPKKNWVDQAGGLPSYIERIAKHLHYDKGMTIGHAIATAVNQCKKWAAGGEDVNPDTRAKAAAAIAQWEAKKVRAKLSKDKSGDQVSTPSTVIANNPLGRKHMPDAISKDDLPDEVVEYIEALESAVDDLTETVAKQAEDLENAPIAKTGDEEADFQALIAKADPAVAEVLKSQREALKTAEGIAKAEREARLEREFISKAEALPHVSESTDDLAGLLRRAADALTPEDTEELEKVLKAANAQIETGSLFAELGTGGAPTTVSKSVEAQAQELRKADPTLTQEQAIAQVYEANPSLYYESIKEA